MLHSPTMPRCLMSLMAISRSRWYSRLVRVCDGATTMLSPVWMPMGSTFSMLHTVMQLSQESRTTSYSTSFQPPRYSSTRIWGEWENAFAASAFIPSPSRATPLPRPPSAYAARIMTG